MAYPSLGAKESDNYLFLIQIQHCIVCYSVAQIFTFLQLYLHLYTTKITDHRKFFTKYIQINVDKRSINNKPALLKVTVYQIMKISLPYPVLIISQPNQILKVSEPCLISDILTHQVLKVSQSHPIFRISKPI